MIAESVAFLRAQGKRVIYDAEHFFDGYADDRDYALRCLRAAAEAGAETVVCCDTNGGTLPHVVGTAMADVVRPRLGAACAVGIHTHDDAGCGVANTLAGVHGGRHPRPGHDERLRRALRQRQPHLDHPQPPAQARLRLPHRRPAGVADPDGPLHRRAAQLHAGSRRALRGSQRVRPQGRHARRRGRRPIRPRSSTSSPRSWATTARCSSPSCRARARSQSRAREAGIELDDDGARHVVERVKELEHRGYHYEAADGSFELLLRKETGEYEPLFRLESWRVIVEKRADGRVETEATIKIWVERRALRAHRRGQRPGQRARPRAARGVGGDLSAPARHRAGQLQGPHPRRDQGHRRRSRGCCWMRPTARRSGARSACRRTSSSPRGRRSSTRWSTGCSHRAAGRVSGDAAAAPRKS